MYVQYVHMYRQMHAEELAEGLHRAREERRATGLPASSGTSAARPSKAVWRARREWNRPTVGEIILAYVHMYATSPEDDVPLRTQEPVRYARMYEPSTRRLTVDEVLHLAIAWAREGRPENLGLARWSRVGSADEVAGGTAMGAIVVVVSRRRTRQMKYRGLERRDAAAWRGVLSKQNKSGGNGGVNIRSRRWTEPSWTSYRWGPHPAARHIETADLFVPALLRGNGEAFEIAGPTLANCRLTGLQTCSQWPEQAVSRA